MSRARQIIAVVLAVAAGAVGTVVVRAEFFGNTTVVSNKVAIAPTKDNWLKEHYEANQKAVRGSADQAIESACAALRRLGTNDAECVQAGSHH